MSLLDSIMSEMGDSKGGGDLGGIAKVLLSGGGSNGSMLDTVVGALKENGMEDKVASWVGNGDNESISSSQLEKVLGSDMMDSLSEKTGVSKEQLSSTLSTMLPIIVNKLTPEGKAQGDGGSLVSTGLNLLKGFL